VLGVTGKPLAGLTVLLPALNEEHNVERAIRATRAAAEAVASHVEVVVVDDGSRDATAARASECGAVVVRHDVNRGYGAALRSGFAAATQPWIFQMDCDNQFDPRELDKLVGRSGEAAIVIGIRTRRADKWRRVWAGRLWNQACRALFGDLAEDIDCGFKLLDRAVVSTFDLRSDGPGISLELCLSARRGGHAVAQVPVGHRPRTAGSPTGLRPRVVVRGVAELLRMRRRFGR
jgi:glycosyltransferase involved in cell wall biosynthesis